MMFRTMVVAREYTHAEPRTRTRSRSRVRRRASATRTRSRARTPARTRTRGGIGRVDGNGYGAPHGNGYEYGEEGGGYFSPMKGYCQLVGGARFSLTARGETQRIRFRTLPALSLVPEARAPPKGCCPTTAPVGLSL